MHVSMETHPGGSSGAWMTNSYGSEQPGAARPPKALFGGGGRDHLRMTDDEIAALIAEEKLLERGAAASAGRKGTASPAATPAGPPRRTKAIGTLTRSTPSVAAPSRKWAGRWRSLQWSPQGWSVPGKGGGGGL
mmetsp:Transcript_54022/g.171440  ORF Transcript_54022/g.171440 Transcript_54022/m.171440 type:complete len:134 (-) Transcript_54022:27-428(-)